MSSYQDFITPYFKIKMRLRTFTITVKIPKSHQKSYLVNYIALALNYSLAANNYQSKCLCANIYGLSDVRY